MGFDVLIRDGELYGSSSSFVGHEVMVVCIDNPNSRSFRIGKIGRGGRETSLRSARFNEDGSLTLSNFIGKAHLI